MSIETYKSMRDKLIERYFNKEELDDEDDPEDEDNADDFE